MIVIECCKCKEYKGFPNRRNSVKILKSLEWERRGKKWYCPICPYTDKNNQLDLQKVATKCYDDISNYINEGGCCGETWLDVDEDKIHKVLLKYFKKLLEFKKRERS